MSAIAEQKAKQRPTVTLLERKIVQCAHSSSLSNIESPFKLGPFDQQVIAFVPIANVFVYEKPRNSEHKPEQNFVDVSRLQRALERLLDYYPHLTGRLQWNEADKSPEVGQLGAGAALLLATCDVALDSLRTGDRLVVTDLPDGGNALLAPYSADLANIATNPMLTVQHTRFSCGGVSLGIRLPHVICDADGYFQFARDLAELYRGLENCTGDSDLKPPSLSNPPEIQSYLKELNDMTTEQRQEADKYEPWLVLRAPPPSTSSESPPPPPIVTGKVFRFEYDELEALKSHATEVGSTEQISTFCALAAHLSQRVYVARLNHARESGISNDNISTQFLAPVNWRQKLGLSKTYFPNAVMATFFSLPQKELAVGPLSVVARTIHDGVRMVEKEELNKLLAWVSAQPNKGLVIPGFRLDQSIFMASQWNKFHLYTGMGLDTDTHGKLISPVLVFPPFTPISLVDGLAYFVATEHQLSQSASNTSTGAIDVALALHEPIWKFLESDPMFRQFQQM